MEKPLPRLSKLVLTSRDGVVLGCMPAFAVETPWMNHAEPVVTAARAQYGIDITVLRLLETKASADDLEVTYLAEVDAPLPPGVAVQPWAGNLAPHPLRLPYAQPGGPAADVAWAVEALKARGMSPSAPPVQVRTWNLSSIWRIPVQGQTVWLKNVPPFFAHEGAMMASMQDKPVPQILAHDGSRVLLREIPGEDMYEAALPDLLVMMEMLVKIQEEWTGRTDELAAIGLPDWREKPLSRMIADVVNRTAAELPPEDRTVLDDFVRTLPQRFADVAACGIADTVVHGDFHPGNVRGHKGKFTILDWGDSGIGHPLLDQPAFLERAKDGEAETLRAHWNAQCRKYTPGSHPERVSELLAPIAAARQAVIYRAFLDGIEPAEHVYHRDDPALWLKKTAAILRKG